VDVVASMGKQHVIRVAAGEAHSVLSLSSPAPPLHSLSLGAITILLRLRLLLLLLLLLISTPPMTGDPHEREGGGESRHVPPPQAALTDRGKLWIWGSDERGRLGLGCKPLPEQGLLDPWDDITNFVAPVRGFGANQLPGEHRWRQRRVRRRDKGARERGRSRGWVRGSEGREEGGGGETGEEVERELQGSRGRTD
jgi:hypothetical protein